MIKIEQFEHTLFFYEKDWDYLNSKNSISICDEKFTLNIECVSTEINIEPPYRCQIQFKINKDFIQEMKAIIMIMEHMREKMS